MLAFVVAYSIGIAAAQLRSVLACAFVGILVLATVVAGVAMSHGAFGWATVVIAILCYNAGIMSLLGLALAADTPDESERAR